MSEPKQDFIAHVEPDSGRKWSEMTGSQRVAYIARVCVCIVTFGLVFPNAFG